MTPEEFTTAMHEVFAGKDSGDTERDHGEADDLMCKVLRDLGYGAGVEIYAAHEKWYA